MATPSRIGMMQKSMARLMRKPKKAAPHREPDADEKGGPSDMDADDKPKFSRTGSISSAGAAVGGAGGGA
jgi:hypothetical protein